MLSWLVASALAISSAPAAQIPGSTPAIDAAAAKVGTPTVVAELDLGKLKGSLRRLAWSDDGSQFYVETAEGTGLSEKLHHYVLPVAGGTMTIIDAAPPWAEKYWAFKSDRASPTDPSLLIDLEQGHQTKKYGTGTAGAAEGGDRAGGNTVMSGANIDREAQSIRQNVFRLTLLGEVISEFVDERPIPGLMFGWGPVGTGVIAYTDRDGRLMLLDLRKHKQTVGGVKDALLPAWSVDGTRLAYVRKSGRKKYALVWSPVAY